MTKTFVILLPPYENENENKNMDIIGLVGLLDLSLVTQNPLFFL